MLSKASSLGTNTVKGIFCSSVFWRPARATAPAKAFRSPALAASMIVPVETDGTTLGVIEGEGVGEADDEPEPQPAAARTITAATPSAARAARRVRRCIRTSRSGRAQRLSRCRCGGWRRLRQRHQAPAAPRRDTLDLDLEREAEEGTDEHEQSKHLQVLHRRVDDDGTDEVGGHEDLEAEQDALAEVRADHAIGPVALAAQEIAQRQVDADEEAENQDGDADDLEDPRDDVHDLFELHLPPLPRGS